MPRRQPAHRLLTDQFGVTFAFDSGALSLDFGYSGGSGRYAVFESLHRPADLAGWLSQSDLGLPTVQVDDDDLAAATQLRDAIWATLMSTVASQPADPAAVAVLNSVAAQPPLIPQLSTAGLSWSHPDIRQALSTIARDAIELFATPDERLRQCAADDCPLAFYDTSRSGRRRWCSMQRCGNRHKVRSHRSRAADQSASVLDPPMSS